MKKIILFLSLFTLGIFVSSFTEDSSNAVATFSNTSNLNSSVYYVPTEKEAELQEFKQNIIIPFSGNKFNGFKEALAFKESQGKYHSVNTFGYLGKYQFGISTLERFNIYDAHLFLNSPELQEDAFMALCSVNKWILRRDIKKNVGSIINGTEITESGILAAAHLSGAGNVKKYLRSGGTQGVSDAYGSSIKHYLKKFSGYDTSIVEANRKPII